MLFVRQFDGCKRWGLRNEWLGPPQKESQFNQQTNTTPIHENPHAHYASFDRAYWLHRAHARHRVSLCNEGLLNYYGSCLVPRLYIPDVMNHIECFEITRALLIVARQKPGKLMLLAGISNHVEALYV